jgi:succinate dehydrogenase flavin-adding protein (antitoxin of CptAB toxin-antitoxin module)
MITRAVLVLWGAVGIAGIHSALAAEAPPAASALQGNTAAGNAPAAPRARASRHPQRLTAGQVTEERVRRLTKILDLNETQQTRLKELLEDERRDIWKVWTENPQPEADRTRPTLAILDRTREQIRAMLNEEQKKKYPAAVPRNSVGPAHADADYWLRMTQQQPKQEPEQGQ